jgi:hypothetical protein
MVLAGLRHSTAAGRACPPCVLHRVGPPVLLTMPVCMLAVLLAGRIIPNEYIVVFDSGVDVRAATVRCALHM